MTRPTDIKTPELWDFPITAYPLALIGVAGASDAFIQEVKDILGAYRGFDPDAIALRPSKTGKYLALKTHVALHDIEEVNALYAALSQARFVKTVL